jgi:hypothetical protein
MKLRSGPVIVCHWPWVWADASCAQTITVKASRAAGNRQPCVVIATPCFGFGCETK